LVKTLLALDTPGDWTTWNLDYYDAVLGEVHAQHAGHRDRAPPGT